MSTLSFILKSAQLGAIGIVAVALGLTYLLLKKAMDDPKSVKTPGMLGIIQSFMKICIYLAAMAGAFQLADTVITRVYDHHDPDASLITTDVLMQNGGEWHWHYGKGNWESVVKFLRRDDGKFDFVATTYFRRSATNGGAADAAILRWHSTEPLDIPKGGLKQLEFKFSKEILPDAGKLDSSLIAGSQVGTVVFTIGPSLRGLYGGGVNDVYPKAGMVLTIPVN